MSDDDREFVRLAETDAVKTDEEGRTYVPFMALEKGGSRVEDDE